LIRYVDTSLLVAALTNEHRTAAAQVWLAKQRADTLAISDWVVTEFSSALSIKLRSRQIGLAHRASALAAFARLVADSFTVLPVLGGHFRTASKFADQHTLGLRAGDALHLAIAGDQGATLCSLDKRLVDAGSAIGVKTLLL